MSVIPLSGSRYHVKIGKNRGIMDWKLCWVLGGCIFIWANYINRGYSTSSILAQFLILPGESHWLKKLLLTKIKPNKLNIIISTHKFGHEHWTQHWHGYSNTANVKNIGHYYTNISINEVKYRQLNKRSKMMIDICIFLCIHLWKYFYLSINKINWHN